ncbi:MAG: hypothetical protein EZS28_002799 [Streblomastix strix]|uniref:Uncharacterized protein n=1 Tax=Streblomastix strix TaxID=222440 RepID=A0A5J4X343_9EUKA|nr:MAG: hypothetical protein EZS28_002799 [Streblomastix strix]
MLALNFATQRIASSSHQIDKGEVNIWNILNGQCEYALIGHTGAINSISFSPSSYLLASFSTSDFKIIVWKLPQHKGLQQIKDAQKKKQTESLNTTKVKPFKNLFGSSSISTQSSSDTLPSNAIINDIDNKQKNGLNNMDNIQIITNPQQTFSASNDIQSWFRFRELSQKRKAQNDSDANYNLDITQQSEQFFVTRDENIEPNELEQLKAKIHTELTWSSDTAVSLIVYYESFEEYIARAEQSAQAAEYKQQLERDEMTLDEVDEKNKAIQQSSKANSCVEDCRLTLRFTLS